MKKLESSLKNMFLVLTGITVISVALLAVVNRLTEGPIAQANADALSHALQEVLPDFDEVQADTVFRKNGEGVDEIYCIIYPAKNKGCWVGSAVRMATSKGYGGDIVILVGFDSEGNILNYSVLASSETPGLGSKADTWFGGYKKGEEEKKQTHSEGNRRSVIGMNPGVAELKVHKDCEDGYAGRVDGITASTITSRAFLNAINAAYAAYAGQETDGKTGASQQNK